VLPTFGADAFNSGATPMLLDMLTDDLYGQATRAVLLQGSNEQILKTIGKETIGISDIEKVALGVRALAGEGLTPQQRENVIEDARARNLDINNALANAVFYGYNNQYFVSRGFPSA
jgi:pyridoxine 5'-phosphate synthase PdxJ